MDDPTVENHPLLAWNDQCATGNPAPVPAIFSNPVLVPAKIWLDLAGFRKKFSIRKILDCMIGNTVVAHPS